MLQQAAGELIEGLCGLFLWERSIKVESPSRVQDVVHRLDRKRFLVDVHCSVDKSQFFINQALIENQSLG